jgi:FKBP-type peptidyl-prolyl cis-trans isomerase
MRLPVFVAVSALAVACLAATPATPASGPAPAGTASLEQRLMPPDNLRLPPSGAIRTASGLRYVVLQRGKGVGHPNATSTVVIDYIGWDFKGRMFDSSLPRGEPSKFELGNLITGWQEALPLMSPGDTFRFWIPGSLAYDGSQGGNSPKGQLVFDITLHSFDNGQ